MGSLDHLWAGWRSAYVQAADKDDPSTYNDARFDSDSTDSDSIDGDSTDGDSRGVGGSLFERILNSGQPDDKTYIVHRGETCFVILNLYPYTNGHVLVLPNRAVTSIEAFDDEEHLEFWASVRDATRAVRGAYGCDGINIGMNLGSAAGAGVPDHLHMHVLPRWLGDTNFMTAVAGSRVMPEPLEESWRKLRANWPA